MEWFGRDFIGLKVQFPKGCPSNWILKEKISENAYFQCQEDCERLGVLSEARAVFRCSKIGGDGPPNAIIKAFMQIPWSETSGKSAEQISAQQTISYAPGYEAEALEMLTRAKCSSTPTFLATKIVQQPSSMWVPGGSLGFILMTKLPGIRIDRLEDLCLEEREAFRQGFKRAWLECHAAGIAPGDIGRRNLLWDAKYRKCYIVDFGIWHDAKLYGGWLDDLYEEWGLMVSLQDGTLMF